MNITRTALSASAIGLLVAALSPGIASAQALTSGRALDTFDPAPTGDAFFGVPSAYVAGHLQLRGSAMFEYDNNPLSVVDGGQTLRIISYQAFLRLDASVALFNRLLISANMPFAVAQGGDNPSAGGQTFQSPSSAQPGNLRIGARLNLYGKAQSPLQLAVGGYLFVPTGPSPSYVSDGVVRGEPQLSLGGRLGTFIWSGTLGTMLRAGGNASSFNVGAGLGVLLANDLVQLGPEISFAVPFKKDAGVTTTTASLAPDGSVNADLLFGAKIRPISSLVIGAAAGPGLGHALGSPVFRALGMIGYDPQPEPGPPDADHDHIPNAVDACPDVSGVSSSDPKKNGCPADADGDGIPDDHDACPNVAGVASDDPKKNGCPVDTDRDGILDKDDACPKIAGAKSDDPKKNGCPLDTDGDSIADKDDACPAVPGVADPDPKKNGCPADSDGDGILDKDDACPNERGVADSDPKKNGCPKEVRVTEKEIVILHQVKFTFGKASIHETVDPVSDELLTEVRDVIQQHPEITKIEVQGHTDEIGGNGYNDRLSQARADAVKGWLVEKGIPADKLVAKGYGESKPLESNKTEDGRQKNRRVEFVILAKTPKAQ